jgi:hypothetical protein
VTDSLSIALSFNQKLDPAQALGSSMVRVWRLPDTVEVPVVSLLGAAKHDSLYRGGGIGDSSEARMARDTSEARKARKAREARRARTDSILGVPDSAGVLTPDTAAVRDTALPTRLARPARPARPPLSDRLSVRLGEQLVPGSSYTLLVRGVRNASGVAVDSTRAGFKVPERPKPTALDTLRMLRMRLDSALQAGDSLRVDSLRQLLPDSLRAVPVDSLLQRLAPPAGPQGFPRAPGDSLRPPSAGPGGARK